MNNRGQYGFLLFFFLFVAILMAVGFGVAILIGIINIASDEIIPEIEGIGTVDDNINITEYAEYTTTPIETLINSFSWMGGLAYMIGIFGLFALAITYRVSMNRIFIFIFFAFALLLLMMSMFMSNIYEEFYNDTDELAVELKDQVLLSWLILYSPMIFAVVIFISGIILFTGQGEEIV